jgi:hypothetical protein
MKYDRRTVDEKALAEFVWELSSEQKETFALMRAFGDAVVTKDADPEQAIEAATAFIEIFSAHLPPAQRREALMEACDTLAKALKALPDDPV